MFDRQGSRKYVNEAERRKFLRAAKYEQDAARRAFCLILYYTGCRISEALNVLTERIDFTSKAVVFETLKRRQRGCFRSVPIPDTLIKLLSSILKNANSGERVWRYSRATAYRLVKVSMERASIAGGMASPKGLRHGFAVACVEKRIPLSQIKKWLGHARLETTAIYLEVAGEEERSLARRIWKE